MKNLRVLGVAAALLAVLALAGAPCLADENPLTAGKFLLEIAKLKNLLAVDDTSAEASLRAAGYDLPVLGLHTELTESGAVTISRALGLNVITQRPEAPFTQERLDRFLSAFGPQLAGSSPADRSAGGQKNLDGRDVSDLPRRFKKSPKTSVPEPD